MNRLKYFGKFLQYFLLFTGIWLVSKVLIELPLKQAWDLLISPIIYGFIMSLYAIFTKIYNDRNAKNNQIT